MRVDILHLCVVSKIFSLNLKLSHDVGHHLSRGQEDTSYIVDVDVYAVESSFVDIAHSRITDVRCSMQKFPMPRVVK